MMRVIHLCLSNYFIDGRLYQENELVRSHVGDGHEVLVVASTEVYDARGHIAYTEPREYLGDEGARVIRLPYRRVFPHALARRIRAFPGVRPILEDFKPDVIMFHGSSAWELRTVSRYAAKHPQVRFLIDSHSDAINSAQGFVSREILHRRFYGPILRQALRHAGPLLCVSQTVIDFARDVYAIPPERLEFFPLGGRMPDQQTHTRLRADTRARLGIAHDEILIVQTGRQDRRKKLPMSLRAFARVPNPQLKFVVAGLLQDDIREECEALISADPRVQFIGWQDADQMTALLCAADVYLQPGTQSATMQHSLCCGCAVILDAVSAHEPYVDGNGWLISTDAQLVDVLNGLRSTDLAALRAASLSFARRTLDYTVLSRRILV